MEPIFDKAAALARAEGDSAFLRELVGVFLKDAAERLAAIHEAIEQADQGALVRAAHSLRGAAASIGAVAAARAAQHLEEVAGDDDRQQINAAVEGLEAAVEQLHPALTELQCGTNNRSLAPSRDAVAVHDHACVLVIDDDPTVRLATQQALRVAGFDVLTAASGDEGVNIARSTRPDIILLDVVLPGESGLDVCQRIKGDSVLATIPVLMASAQRTSSDSRAHGLDAGADGYIVRPVENHELVAWVRAMLRVKAAEAERVRLQRGQRLEAIGRLAGGVAHDFNNRLTVMKGYVQFLMKKLPEGDPCRADAERVDATIDTCAQLVHQLLAFSRRKPLNTTVLECNELVQELAPKLRLLLGDRIRLQVHAAADVHRIRADRDQLAEVLMNLAANARDAIAPAGGGAVGDTLTVETANVQAEVFAHHVVGGHVVPGPYVMLAVSDNGAGMPPEVRERIFEPFFTTKEVGQGAGLGLATVFGIMTQHRGYIACDTVPGRGTTFRLYFPSADSVSETAASPPAPRRQRRRAAQPPTVLVVEDEDNLRELLVQTLEGAGYHVCAAASAGDALEAVARLAATVDVLLTDVVMPGEDGPALARRLTRAHPRLGVVFISGYARDLLDLSELPGARFLQKPFGLDELARVVAELVPG